MITKNVDLMRMARESLKGKWNLAVKASLIFMLISLATGVVPIAGSLASLIIAGPLALGFAIFALNISRNKEIKIDQIFSGFNHFGKTLVTYLLIALFTLLWALLLIIPGIIAALSYSMSFFILADDNNLDALEVLDKSKKMMYGYKWKLFRLGLRFLGWGIICVLTLGIGFLWLLPYMQVSYAKFYEDIKNKEIGNQNPKEEKTEEKEVVNSSNTEETPKA